MQILKDRHKIMTMSRPGLAIVSSSDKAQLQTQIQIQTQIERQMQILKDKHKIMTMSRPGLAIVSSSENECMTRNTIQTQI